MEKEQKNVCLLSKDEVNLLLFDLLKDGKFKTFQQRIKEGYGITAFVLTAMLNYGYEDKIEQVVSSCKCWTSDVFDFLVQFWNDREKAEDFWIQHADKDAVSEKISDEALVRYQRWDDLLARKKYELLAEHAPLEFLEKLDFWEKLEASSISERKSFFSALVKQKRFEDVLALDKKWASSDYFYNTEMMRYLLEHDIDKFFNVSLGISISDRQALISRLGFKKDDDFYQYLYDKGQIEFLMQRTDFLSRHELWAPYVEKRIWGTLAYYKKYDLIDWEDWGKRGKRHSYHALRTAIEAQNWDFLVKQKAHWKLLKHFRLIRFIKSFF